MTDSWRFIKVDEMKAVKPKGNKATKTSIPSSNKRLEHNCNNINVLLFSIMLLE